MVSGGNEGSSGIVLHCVDNDKVVKETLWENDLLIDVNIFFFIQIKLVCCFLLTFPLKQKYYQNK